MAYKRTAVEAFGAPAARAKVSESQRDARPPFAPQSAFAAFHAGTDEGLATAIGEEPYDGHYSKSPSPSLQPHGLQEEAKDAPRVRLSNFQAEPVVSEAVSYQINLKAEESLTALGEFDLKVISGVVSFYGAMLTSESATRRAYTFTTAALPAIVARKDSTIQLKSVPSMIARLEKYSPLFRNIGAKSTRMSFELVNMSTDDERTIAPLEIGADVKKVLSRVSASLDTDKERHSIMVVGPKSSGKSTLSRLLCNMITSRPSQSCLYLDLDPGQPEFGPPGQLSLVSVHAPMFGPPLTHQASENAASFKLIRAHTIAATSFKDDSDHYVSCAVDLIRHASRSVPVIINSCGWVSGLGAVVLMELVRQLHVRETVVLQPVTTQLDTDLGRTSRVHHVARRLATPSVRSPAEQRAMQTMAYFHHRPCLKHPHIRWVDKAIGNVRPWTVSYSGSVAAITAILCLYQAPHPDFLTEAINGRTVGIVLVDEDVIDPALIQRTAPDGLPYMISPETGYSTPPDPQRSHSIGIALVRGIDTHRKELHLVTGLTEAQTSSIADKQLVLVCGNYDTPEWAYLEDIYVGEQQVSLVGSADRPWVISREGGRGGVQGAIWRQRHPPTK